MNAAMASAASIPAFSFSNHKKPHIISFSFAFPYSKILKFHRLITIPHHGTSFFSHWNGFSHLGSSLKQKNCKKEKKGRWRSGVVHASLFGVGAPEALVIGVVALLVFGPKGLAEVARNLGKTLRAFQPTIRELQDVSREFKSTLEREIGLDEVPSSMNNTYNSTSRYTNEDPQATIGQNGPRASTTQKPYSSEDYLKITEEQLKAAAAKQQTQTPIVEEQPQEVPKIASVSEPSETLENGRN